MALYSVVMQSHCGMTSVLESGVDYVDAQARVKRRLAWFERVYGGEVIRLDRNSWELCEPDACCMIPDACGILLVQKDKQVVIR